LNGTKNILKINRMTIGIDMVGTSLGSGTKTYNLNFIKYLNEINLNEQTYIFISKNYLKEISKIDNKKIKYIIKSDLFSNIFFRFLWMQFLLPFELKKLKINKFYSPMNFGPLFLRFFKIKFILALHSNLPWVFFSKMPGNLIRNFLTKLMMEMSIYVCNILIVDSNFAKKEIIEALNIEEKKVFVIYLGIDPKYLNNKNMDYLNNFHYRNYILSVLSCVKYHNIINLLKAFKLLKKENASDLCYVIVLQVLDKKYFLEIQNYVKNNFQENEILFLHDLKSNYLVNLYKKANFYLFSSYCEVFGLTSLEAMSQGCPVLISNKSAMPEINGDAAKYFDPDDILQIKRSMNEVISNYDYRKNLIVNGNIHFKKFSWRKTLKETIQILDI